MTATLLWGPFRSPVPPFYLNRDQGISGNKLAALNDRVDGQLWERVAESAVVADVERDDSVDVNVIEAIDGTVIRRVQLAEIPHEHVPGYACPNCGHLALRRFWVNTSLPWPPDDIAHRELARS